MNHRNDMSYNHFEHFPSGSSSVVERQLPKLNVAGSIPVSRSRGSLSQAHSKLQFSC